MKNIVNPDTKIKKPKQSLIFVIRTTNMKPDVLTRQLALLSGFYDVEVYSFYRLPPTIQANVTMFPPGANAQNFVAYIPKGKFQLAYLYLDDNSNSYTIQEQLKKIGIKILSKTVVREETEEKKEEPKDENPDDSTRQSFVF